MRVLQINSVCGVGSTGRIATDLDTELKTQGYESFIAYGRDSISYKNAIKIGTKIDNYFHVLKSRIFDSHGFESRKSTIQFIEKIKDLKPDVIHLHNLHGYYINIKLLFDFLKSSDTKIIWTLHDCWAFTGHCSHFENVNCEKWKTGCHSCPQKTGYPASFLMDQSHRNFHEKQKLFTGLKNLIIVSPSQWLSNLIKQSFLSEYPIKVINNGIDLDIFKPIKSDFRTKYNLREKFIILGVANIWSESKGLKFFIELAKQLHHDEVIFLVGLTNNQIKMLPPNVIGIAKTNNTLELAEMYSSSDVYVNPTLVDNFPTTNLEALASGTPVITFNTGGSVESIDSNCGIVVEKGNIDKLYNAIKEIRKTKISERECTERAKRYDKRNCVQKYIEIYQN